MSLSEWSQELPTKKIAPNPKIKSAAELISSYSSISVEDFDKTIEVDQRVCHNLNI